MYICNLGKGDIEELDKIVKTTLRKQGFLGKQASDERLYGRREDGGQGLKFFKEVYARRLMRKSKLMLEKSRLETKIIWIGR